MFCLKGTKEQKQTDSEDKSSIQETDVPALTNTDKAAMLRMQQSPLRMKQDHLLRSHFRRNTSAWKSIFGWSDRSVWRLDGRKTVSRRSIKQNSVWQNKAKASSIQEVTVALSGCSTYDCNTQKQHQSRENWQLLSSFANCERHAALLCCSRTQLLHKSSKIVFVAKDGTPYFQAKWCYWAGLSQDLVIEQVLMKNLKSGGGLTRET